MPTPLVPRLLSVFRQWPAILAAACVLAIDVFDSFGLDQAADEQAARIVGTVTAPFYGDANRTGQNAVTVVLVDDASLEYMNWPTPLPYGVQGEIISTIASYEPAAIFMDFSYLRPHGEDPEAEIAQYAGLIQFLSRDYGIPIFLGEIGQGSTFAPLRAIPSVGVQWHEDTWLNYPLQDHAWKPMAAVELYKAWCERNPDKCKSPVWAPPQVERPERPRRLSLEWGFGGSRNTAALSNDPEAALRDECVMPDNTWATRLRVSMRESLGSLGREFFNAQQGEDNAEARCIYADTLNAATLLVGDNAGAVESLVHNRVVLVGAAHRQSADLQTIPPIGIVPGVYVHAMATDNLIEYGEDYHRPPPDGFLDLDFADMVEIGLSLVLFGMVVVMLRFVERMTPGTSAADRSKRRRRLWLGALTLGAAFVALAAAIEYALHWPPLNVVGVILLVAVVFSYVERHEKRLAEGPSETDNG